jgi:hypothetical protein
MQIDIFIDPEAENRYRAYSGAPFPSRRKGKPVMKRYKDCVNLSRNVSMQGRLWFSWIFQRL